MRYRFKYTLICNKPWDDSVEVGLVNQSVRLSQLIDNYIHTALPPGFPFLSTTVNLMGHFWGAFEVVALGGECQERISRLLGVVYVFGFITPDDVLKFFTYSDVCQESEEMPYDE